MQHLVDDVHCIFYLTHRLSFAKVLIKLPKNVNGSFESLARSGRHGVCSFGGTHATGNLTGELVKTILLRPLERNIVGCAWVLTLDDIELTENELDLAQLPEIFVIGSALIVLATEEGPVGDIAGACFVAAEVIGDDLARPRYQSVDISYSS